MKRLIAVICTVAMLFSFTTGAFASELDFLEKTYYSYDGTMEFYVELNKPLEFLAFANEGAGFDVKYLTESLLKTKITAKVQAEISPEMDKAKMYMAFNPNVPVHISEDLKFNADVTGHMWMEYDFSNIENAKMNIIVKNPLNGEYLYLNYFDAFTDLGVDVTELKQMMVESFTSVKDADTAEMTGIAKDAYENNAEVEKDGEYVTLSFTNNSFVDAMYAIIMGMFKSDYMAQSLAAEGVDVSALEYDENQIAAIVTFIKGLGIFGDTDAYTYKVKLNDEGYMEEGEERLHIDVNIYDLAVALGATGMEMTPFTKENSDVDLTFCSKAVYNKINEDNVVQMPTLTEENSTNLLDLMLDVQTTVVPEPGIGNDYYYDEDFYVEYETYQPEAFWDYARGAMDRGGMYVEVEGFLESAQWDEDNLTGNAELGEDGAVIMTLTSDNFGTVTVTGNLYDDEYMLNSTKLWTRKPFKVVEEYNWDTYTGDKKLYVNMEVLNYILAAKVQSVTTYITDDYGVELTNPEYYFDIVRPNPAYVPSEQ